MTHMSDDAVATARSQALKVFAAMRAHGALFYQEYMAIRRSPARDGICEIDMPVEAQAMDPREHLAVGALATLADIALGTSIRTVADPSRRTATVSLTLQLVREPPAGRVHARAEVVSVESETGISQCRFADGRGELFATASGIFALRSVPEKGFWLPYAQGSALADFSLPAIGLEDLSSEERWLLKHVEDSLRSDNTDGHYGSYLGIGWQTRGTGQSLGIWPFGPHISNRVAQVQGGAMFGALAAAATACLPTDLEARIVEQHVQYIRPGRRRTLRVEASVLRRGERLTSVEASVADEDGEAVARALVTLEGITSS